MLIFDAKIYSLLLPGAICSQLCNPLNFQCDRTLNSPVSVIWQMFQLTDRNSASCECSLQSPWAGLLGTAWPQATTRETLTGHRVATGQWQCLLGQTYQPSVQLSGHVKGERSSSWDSEAESCQERVNDPLVAWQTVQSEVQAESEGKPFCYSHKEKHCMEPGSVIFHVAEKSWGITCDGTSMKCIMEYPTW